MYMCTHICICICIRNTYLYIYIYMYICIYWDPGPGPGHPGQWVRDLGHNVKTHTGSLKQIQIGKHYLSTDKLK